MSTPNEMNEIKQDQICPCCRRRLLAESETDLQQYRQLEEDLEARSGLIENRDFAGLVSYLEELVVHREGDLYAVKDLGEAYVKNGEPQRAIELLTPVHRRRPDFKDVQWVILDALFSLGRDETCFQWTRPLTVLRLGTGVLDACWAYLEQQADPCDLEELYCELLALGYLAFDELQLLSALRGDSRFKVEEGPYWTAVRIAES